MKVISNRHYNTLSGVLEIFEIDGSGEPFKGSVKSDEIQILSFRDIIFTSKIYPENGFLDAGQIEKVNLETNIQVFPENFDFKGRVLRLQAGNRFVGIVSNINNLRVANSI